MIGYPLKAGLDALLKGNKSRVQGRMEQLVVSLAGSDVVRCHHSHPSSKSIGSLINRMTGGQVHCAVGIGTFVTKQHAPSTAERTHSGFLGWSHISSNSPW